MDITIDNVSSTVQVICRWIFVEGFRQLCKLTSCCSMSFSCWECKRLSTCLAQSMFICLSQSLLAASCPACLMWVSTAVDERGAGWTCLATVQKSIGLYGLFMLPSYIRLSDHQYRHTNTLCLWWDLLIWMMLSWIPVVGARIRLLTSAARQPRLISKRDPRFDIAVTSSWRPWWLSVSGLLSV